MHDTVSLVLAISGPLVVFSRPSFFDRSIDTISANIDPSIGKMWTRKILFPLLRELEWIDITSSCENAWPNLKRSFINYFINILTERQFTGRMNLFDFDFSPQLTWRDIQHLTVLTSKRNSLFDAKGRFHWTMNGVGLEFNHLFGYGVLDAGAMVALAKKWKTVPPRYHCEAGSVLETQWVYFHSLFHSISRVREKHRLALFLSSLHFPFTS